MQKLMGLLALIVFFLAFFFIQDNSSYVDEYFHFKQIQIFYQGKFEVDPYITTIPGYHLVLAVIAKIFGISTLSFLRTINFILSFLSIVTFYCLVSRLDYDQRSLITVQYIFFPILFPFFFLLYTDVLSLFLVMLSFYFMLLEMNRSSGIMGIFSMAIRQTNIIWLAFEFIYIYFSSYNKIDKNYFKDHCIRNWTFILGFLLFLIIAFINKGFSLGDRSAHPNFSFHLGNIFFILILFFFFFLPLNLYRAKKIINYLKIRREMLAYSAIIFVIYLFTFNNTHPYNIQGSEYFLRNKLLAFIDSSFIIKIIFFLPVAYSIFSLSITRLKNRQSYLLYPATFVFLIPSWLIEQRYYLIPFILFIILREKHSDSMEAIMAAYYFFLSIVIYYLIYNNLFFL
jgi:alpha-1,2-glucosyltransferase